MFAQIFAKRLLAAAVVIAALGYVAVTHMIAADVYTKDRTGEKETDDSEQ